MSLHGGSSRGAWKQLEGPELRHLLVSDCLGGERSNQPSFVCLRLSRCRLRCGFRQRFRLCKLPREQTPLRRQSRFCVRLRPARGSHLRSSTLCNCLTSLMSRASLITPSTGQRRSLSHFSGLRL